MKQTKDAYGQHLLAQYKHHKKTAEIIERDDGFIATGSEKGIYFRDYAKWSKSERQAIKLVKGKVLDVGCGAGRHSLYLQEKGFDVTGIDNSPGAIKVCKLRGLEKAKILPIEQSNKLPARSFDTIIMLGNNFGLMANPTKARQILKKFDQITSDRAQIIAQSRNRYLTDNPVHLAYHELNRRRGRAPGQIRMRVRFANFIGNWFDYLFVSPAEVNQILKGTGWTIRRTLVEGPEYIAVIDKEICKTCTSRKAIDSDF